MIRVLIAAASALERAGLEALLASSPALLVVGRAAGTAGVSAAAEEHRPEVIVLVLEPGEELPAPLRSAAQAALVVLTDEPQGAWAAEALRSGVRGLLPREAASAEIVAAVEATAAGLVALHPDAAAALAAAAPSLPRGQSSPRSQALSPREAEVLSMLARGLVNKEIAARLHISEHTVKFHLGSIFAKLGASSRTEAVTRGIRQGLIPI